MKRALAVIILFVSVNAYAYTLLPAKKHSVITGHTRAVNTMTITAESAGRLAEVKLGMGDVSDGETFAVIDPTFILFGIKSLKASLKKLEASIKRLESNRDYLKKEYERSESLYMSEVETESRRDAAKNGYDQAELGLAELKADRDSLMVSLAELEERLRRNYIKVPAGWQITTKPLEAGELVNPGQMIASAGDFRRLIVPVFIDNEQLSYLKSKKTIDVAIDGKSYQATLHRVSPAFDEQSRKRHAEILLNIEGTGGMLVNIPVETSLNGLMVDKHAVNERYANPRVISGGREIKVTVTGRDGDMILLSPNAELKAGMELEAIR